LLLLIFRWTLGFVSVLFYGVDWRWMFDVARYLKSTLADLVWTAGVWIREGGTQARGVPHKFEFSVRWINDIVLSESNLPSFTHWWNWQSSNVTLPALVLADLFVWLIQWLSAPGIYMEDLFCSPSFRSGRRSRQCLAPISRTPRCDRGDAHR
jgi:hypothetical protein